MEQPDNQYSLDELITLVKGLPLLQLMVFKSKNIISSMFDKTGKGLTGRDLALHEMNLPNTLSSLRELESFGLVSIVEDEENIKITLTRVGQEFIEKFL